MSRFSTLYRGDTHIDFLGRRKIGYIASAVLIAVTIGSLAFQGLNLGIDFRGGIVWTVRSAEPDVVETRDVLRDFGLANARIQVLGSDRLRIQADADDAAEEVAITAALEEEIGPVEELDTVGPSWGREITNAAQRALLVFFAAIALYITLRFEWKMAIAALIAVFHDVLIAVGVYSVFQFEVTPATVIAFLTILGYSLYDTIVVFDKVQENAIGMSSSGGETYTDMTNRSMNDVFMRSVNTTITSLMPVMGLLLIGAYALGARTLEEFGIALAVGLLVGAYSSIFIAAPVLATLKEREPRYANLRSRLEGRKSPIKPSGRRAVVGTPADRGAVATDTSVDTEPAEAGGDTTTRPARRPTPAPSPYLQGGAPRPRKKGKRR